MENIWLIFKNKNQNLMSEKQKVKLTKEIAYDLYLVFI